MGEPRGLFSFNHHGFDPNARCLARKPEQASRPKWPRCTENRERHLSRLSLREVGATVSGEDTLMKRTIIVGASSGIGAELARQLAAKQHQLILLARSRDKIEALAAELREKYGPLAAEAVVHDVTHTDTTPALFVSLVEKLGTLDWLVYNSGVLYEPGPEDYGVHQDLEVIDVNLRGAIPWLDSAASYFSKKGSGTIVGVGSVAGDRGRRKMPAYHAAKAGFATFLESLWNRLSLKGVRVVTIKPGPIDTPMTDGRMAKAKLYPVDKAVKEMICGIERGCRVVYVPGKWRLIMFIVKLIPPFIFRHLPI